MDLREWKTRSRRVVNQAILIDKYSLFSPNAELFDVICATVLHPINGVRIKACRLHLNGIKAQRRLICFLTARNFRALFA